MIKSFPFQQCLLLSQLLLMLFGTGTVYAAPGDPIFSDDFNRATLGTDWAVSDGNLGGINAYLVSTGNSGFTRGDVVTITSISGVIDLSGIGGADFSIEIGKGTDGAGTLSEDPEAASETFAIEFLESDLSTWTVLTSLAPGDLADGATTSFSTSLPSEALHAGFQLRFAQGGGDGGPPANSGTGWDYWHFDDILFLETGFTLPPPPLSASMCEEFEFGLDNWTQSDTSRSGISAVTSLSPSNSLFLHVGANEVTSDIFDGSSLSTIEVWVRKGDDLFSENPETGEDLVLEYFNTTSATWVEIDTFQAGTIANGGIVTPTYTAGPDFVTDPSFQIRFRQTGGSGANFDYWHIDDVCFSGGTAMPNLSKTVLTFSDTLNSFPNAKAIPEAIVQYTVSAMNLGDGAAVEDSIMITDTLDENLTLFVGDLNGSGSPFIFDGGTGSSTSGLDLEWISLASPDDSVVFLNSSDVSITPMPDYDSNVRSFVISLRGSFFAAGSGIPQFTITYRARID